MTKKISNIGADRVIIEIKRTTRERLKDSGSKRDTYDDIICRLLENS